VIKLEEINYLSPSIKLLFSKFPHLIDYFLLCSEELAQELKVDEEELEKFLSELQKTATKERKQVEKWGFEEEVIYLVE
jgi:uncharacterized protein (DUF2342 family)